MKTNKMFLLLLVAAFGFACGNNGTNNGGNEPDATKTTAFFPASSVNAEIDPTSANSYAVKIERSESENAAEITITVSDASEGVEVAPIVKFAAGAKEAAVTVSIPAVKDGENYSVTLAIAADNWNSFSAGSQKVVVNIEAIKWDATGTGILLDDAFTGYFGLSKYAWQVPYKFKTFADGSAKLRLVNPWISYATAAAVDGIFDGCPYWDEGDVDEEGTYNFDFAINARGGVQLANSPAYTGYTEPSYGDVYVLQYDEEGFGIYTPNVGIEFDKKDAVLVVCDDDGPWNAAGLGFYFTKEAYLAATYIEPADATVDTYVGAWELKGVNYYTEADTVLNVVISSQEDEDGQYYVVKGLDENVDAYGYFDEDINMMVLYTSASEETVEIEGADYNVVFYPYGASYITFAPGENGSLVVADNSDTEEFGILYQDDNNDANYFFTYILSDIVLTPAQGDEEEGGDDEEAAAPKKVKAAKKALKSTRRVAKFNK